MAFARFSRAQRTLVVIMTVTIPLFAACSSSRSKSPYGEYLPPRVKWYAHCDTCNWCDGAFKTSAEVQRTVSEHNIELHDWIKVAYYNQTKCAR